MSRFYCFEVKTRHSDTKNAHYILRMEYNPQSLPIYVGYKNRSKAPFVGRIRWWRGCDSKVWYDGEDDLIFIHPLDVDNYFEVKKGTYVFLDVDTYGLETEGVIV